MEPEPKDLDWIQLREEMGKSQAETQSDKFARKFKENPFVPIGCLATVGALSYGLWCFRRGKSKMSQTMMRLRIVAQGFTVVALVSGVVITTGKNLNKNSSQ
ncbi:HIG1 domain family member 2A [Aricia agestis]|uniref:HIG1 domain family member 2A n=1 Tax=Aricia agestis TaxID=91739 RepID=UPI001C202EFD|nr:HIG1 domain family member 2A [Aricia agestis]